ncbi:MAG: helix-turn-helix domain-containing protein [Candidatus Moraniibacteriota bacterium]|nr:MAG: helix-turn-helix domain-containing protein [Candidatus Moranbacteria bacterium]
MVPKVGFIRKKVRSLTLGERIIKTRNERGLSLVEISKHTGIRTKYLEAIEKGDMNALPAPVYVHGFLRSYARYLGEDEERFIVLFDRERGIAKNLSLKDNDEEQSRNLWSSPKPLVSHAITPSFLISFLFLFLFLGGLWYIYSGLSKFVSEPQIFIASPEGGSIIKGSSVLLEGKTDVNAELYVNDRKVLVDESGNFSERIEIRKGTNTLVLRSKNAFEKEIEKTVTVIGEWEDVVEKISENEKQLLPFFLENRSNISVKIQISIDSGTIQEFTLQKKEKKEFFGNEKAVISSDIGKDVYIQFGDETASSLDSSPGKISEKEIIFSKMKEE